MYYVYGIGTFGTHGTRTFDSLCFLFAKIEEKVIRFLRFISPLGHVPVVSVGGVFHSMLV